MYPPGEYETLRQLLNAVLDALADYGVTTLKCQSLPSAFGELYMMVGHRHSDPRSFVVYGLNGDVR